MRLLVDERQPRLGRGLGDHGGHLRLHQPHPAARGAGDLAAGAVRRVAAAAPRDHLRDQPPLPRRGAREVPRRRRPAAAHVADRRGRRQERADGAPGHRRQPRGQRRRRAALRAAQGECAQGLLRAVAGAVHQRDQRRHAAAVPGAVQPGPAGADRRHDRRGLADRPGPARGLEPYADDAAFRGKWREVKRANKARLADYRAVDDGRRAESRLAVRHPGQAHPRVQAPAPQRAAHHHAVPPAQAGPRISTSRRGRSSSAARRRPATSWPSESSS